MKKGQARTLQAVFTFVAGLMILIGILFVFDNYVIPSISKISFQKNSEVLLGLVNSQITRQYQILKEENNVTRLNQMISTPKKINRRGFSLYTKRSFFPRYFTQGGDGNWSYRRKIEIMEKAGDTGDKKIKIELSKHNISYKEVRLTRKGETLKEWNCSSEGNLILRVNLEANELSRNIYLYYGNPQAEKPSYVTNISNPETGFSASLLKEEEKYEVCMEYEGKPEEYCEPLVVPIEAKGKANSRSNLRIQGTKIGSNIEIKLANSD